MKRILTLGFIFALLVSCDSENANEETQSTESPQEEEINVIVEDNNDELPEYDLGPRPEHPLLNYYGEDSVDVDGNLVYPARDTIWLED